MAFIARHAHLIDPGSTDRRRFDPMLGPSIRFSISIVSHGSSALLPDLLDDLRRCRLEDSEILLTFNIPEDETFLHQFTDLPLRILRNVRRRGFGDNHNQAFAASAGRYFVIVNPDVRLGESPFERLVAGMDEEVGARAPVVMSPNGGIEDSARRFPTVARLAKRTILGRRQADYAVEGNGPIAVDWSAGMFVVYARAAYETVAGFDTRYFMYMEDADICRRLWRSGFKVQLIASVHVVHDARRASRRNARHLSWHLRSALRFLIGI